MKPTAELAKLLVNLKQTGGWDGLTELIYNSTASLNGFDQYGHFGRTRVTLSNCVEYKSSPGGYSGCVRSVQRTRTPAKSADTSAARSLPAPSASALAAENGGTLVEPGPAIGVGQGDSTEGRPEGEAGVAQSSKTEGTEPLLDYLLGP